MSLTNDPTSSISRRFTNQQSNQALKTHPGEMEELETLGLAYQAKIPEWPYFTTGQTPVGDASELILRVR